jgi:hypothetical protein
MCQRFIGFICELSVQFACGKDILCRCHYGFFLLHVLQIFYSCYFLFLLSLYEILTGSMNSNLEQKMCQLEFFWPNSDHQMR